MIDKQWAKNCLRHHRNSAFLSLCSMQLLNSDAVLNLQDKHILIQEEEVIFNPEPADYQKYKYLLDLNQVVHEYFNDNNKHLESLLEFYKAIRRALIKESFEVIKAYADKTNKSQELKAYTWYQFTRIVRNAISHDFHFNFNNHDLTLLPVTWNNVAIDATLNGQPLTSNIIPHGLVWDLYFEMVNFVEEN